MLRACSPLLRPLQFAARFLNPIGKFLFLSGIFLSGRKKDIRQGQAVANVFTTNIRYSLIT